MSGLPQPIPLVPPPVLASAVRASVLGHGDRRLEAENYLIEGYRLRQRIEVAKAIPLSVFAKVWQPNRLKGTQVAPGNGKPFLAATQVFAARPSPRKWLSIQRTPDVEQRYVKPGWILVTCSGSVGDAIVAYRPLDGIIISHDLLRVVPLDAKDQGFLYTYLRTRFARAMMRSTKYGNVIKHLEPEHLDAVPVVTVSDRTKATLSNAITSCFGLRNRAHDLLLKAEAIFADSIGPVDAAATETGFPVNARDLFSHSRRLDAYSYNPRAAAILARIKKAQLRTTPLETVTDRVWWMTRFARVFGDEGVPYLSAEELFAVNPPVSKRVMAGRVANAEEFFVKAGWIVMACSGQIYGLNGSVALMTKAHEASFLSHDLIRIIANKEIIRPGYLFVALGHPQLGRPLVLRISYGTSIPHLDPFDVQGIPIVRLQKETEDGIADMAEQSAVLRVAADEIENAAVAYLEAIIAHALGDESQNTIDATLGALRLAEMEAHPDKVIQGPVLAEKMKQWLA